MSRKPKVRADAPVQLPLSGVRARPNREPAAQRQQLTSADWDLILVDLARVNHPTVAWWWGTRRIEGGPGAYCYICSEFIVTFDTSYAMTAKARRDVDAHRAQHWPDAKRYLDGTA